MRRRAFLWDYERRTEPLLPRRRFYRRILRTALAGGVFLVFALGLGMVGYHLTEQMSWIDSFANAAMILSGMGPLGNLQSHAGKIFAGCYALFSGLAFITVTGFILAPFAHRMFHRFHLADELTAKK
ncbi:MAG TPA: hypothetical protein VHC86_06510 [Opitutaceae bacterium]|nr:hypothetical protein [Opitutaceae bacterium]